MDRADYSKEQRDIMKETWEKEAYFYDMLNASGWKNEIDD